MSPASKSKPKDKKAGNEPQKALSKPSGTANAGSGVTSGAYNPTSGTFHTLGTVPTPSASPLHANGRFRNIDDTDDHFVGSLGAGVEYDSISNNGSWSGESEDHKEKASNPNIQQETIPGADNDKREKIRQKNERKHQRQKERRAQELHERCSGYLMSRKLEALAQRLVAMGIPHERATMALILNEGKMEESVTWLFDDENANKPRDQNLDGANLKIDISDELARIADMEIRYKCTRQDVERAVVVSEGDLEKAEESLRALKLEPPSASHEPEGTGDPPTAINIKFLAVASQNVTRLQPKPNLPSMEQQRRDDKDFNYAKPAIPMAVSSESLGKNMQSLKRIQPKVEWAKPQHTAAPAEKRWPNAASNPSISYSLASPLQVSPPPVKTETCHVPVAVGIEKNLQPGTVREPVIMMQRARSVNTKQVPTTSISSSPPGTSTSWYPSNSSDITKSNGLMSHIPSTRSSSSNQMFHQLQYQQQHFVSGDSSGTNKGNGLWSRAGASPPTLSPASSLGLYSGLGSTGSSGASSPVDWSTAGSMVQLDYTNIDWSLNRGLLSPKPDGLWVGQGSLKSSAQMYDSSASALGGKLAMRSTPITNGVHILGLQDGGIANAETSTSSSWEWTSPFEGKDLFSLPRQFVSSPLL